MEENTTGNNTQFPKILKSLSVCSVCLGVFSILTAFLSVLFWTTFGSFDSQGEQFLSHVKLPRFYAQHLSIALYGVLFFAGGRWCLEAKKLGWHIMSACLFISMLLHGILLYNSISFDNFSPCLIFFVPLFIFCLVSYLYLFTDEPRKILKVQDTK